MSGNTGYGGLPPERQASIGGGAILPALAGIIFGLIYYFAYSSLAVSSILVLGGIASIICIQAMMSVFYGSSGRGWAKAVGALSGFVPYFYSLFLICFLGLWSGWLSIAKYHGIGAIAAAFFWILVGWRMLYALGKITRKERA